MKMKNLFCLLLSLLALIIVGCGGGGGGFGGTTVSGVAAKGLINGGTVKVFEIISSQNPAKARIGTTPLGQATTAADGSYAVNIGSAVTKGGLLIQVTGGTYKDEATGSTINLVDKTGASGLRAVFGNISGAVRRGTGVVANVTPFTELGVQVLPDPAHPTDASITTANAQVSATFPALNGVNIVTTKPIDVTTAPPAGTTAAQLNYSVALATVSELLAGATTLPQLDAQFLPDVLSQSGLSAANLAAAIAAELNFLNNPNNKTGATGDALGTMTVTATPSATAVDINSNVTITANVTLNGAAVPDGTQVTFAVKSGTGTLSAASAAAVNGTAAVTLTSATDGAAVVVTASAGGVSTDVAAVTFTDPNRPTAVIVTANPATGSTTGTVTISASVTRLAGGAVADGTTVNFAVTSGTGILSATSGFTNGGIASVTLTSTVVGTVVVKATAGTASGTVSVPFVSQPTQAIVKLATSSTLPAGAKIGAINAIATYATNKGLSITDAGVATSGVGVGSTLIPNTTTAGQINLGLLNAPAGITSAGEFATLTFSVAAGNFPTAADFAIAAGAEVLDLSTNVQIPGVTVTIQSVTLR